MISHPLKPNKLYNNNNNDLVTGRGDDGQIKGHGYQETGDGKIEGGEIETKLHEPTWETYTR